MEAILELKNISAGYEKKPVIRDVNFTLHEYDFVGIVGPNGGGKTTLLKVILGLLKPLSGSVNYYVPKHSLFGYLPQNSTFDNRFPITVEEVVLSGLFSEKGVFKSYNKKDRERARAILDSYGMGSYAKRQIGELSGGERQRVFLCRAVISSPKVLILDEPVTYVDNHFEQEFYSILKELNRSRSIIMVSHDIGTICSYVKSIACVNGGLHYHDSNLISMEQLKEYSCPIELISHGTVPHRILMDHDEPERSDRY